VGLGYVGSALVGVSEVESRIGFDVCPDGYGGAGVMVSYY
jgi:hypothetical protein